MFKFLKLVEIFLIHDVSIQSVLQIIFHLSVSFLPIILPMSLLFAILLTYSRLSANSEIVALKAIGYSPLKLSLPAISFSCVITLLAMQTLFSLGPMARFNFDRLLNQIGNQKIISSIQEGTFSESFFDLVVYTNEIDKTTNTMKDLFIFDNRNPKNPVSIVAKEGTVDNTTNDTAQSASILLKDGDIYQLSQETKTKVKFDTYNISISDPVVQQHKHQDSDTYTLRALGAAIVNPKISDSFRKVLKIERHKRWAIALSCLMFGFLGSALGSRTNRRTSSSTGFIVSVICIVGYWLLFMVGSNLAQKGHIPIAVGLWFTNVVFLAVTFQAWRLQYKKM